MAKLTIKVGGGGAGTKEEVTGGPSRGWLKKNIGNASVTKAVKSSFALYRLLLRDAMVKQFLSTAPANDEDSKAQKISKGKYPRAMDLPYGSEEGKEVNISKGAVPPPGVMSGELAKAIGKADIIFSGGEYKVVWGTDLRISKLDYYLHKTLVKHKKFPKLFLPPEFAKGGAKYEAAKAKAMNALRELEIKSKKKK